LTTTIACYLQSEFHRFAKLERRGSYLVGIPEEDPVTPSGGPSSVGAGA